MNTKAQYKEIPSILSIDSYDRKIVTGRFWQGDDSAETKFTGLMQLTLLIEQMLEKAQGPSGESRCKRFARPETAEPAAETLLNTDPRRGALATFRLRILFRQNLSWQGLLTWVEGQQEQSFRSYLELAMLLDSALCFAVENKNTADTND